jgi:hypothetical protein
MVETDADTVLLLFLSSLLDSWATFCHHPQSSRLNL